MAYLFSTLTCLLLGVAFASAKIGKAGTGKCPEPPVQEHFQVAQYLGKWYDYAHYEVFFEIGSKCIQAVYSMRPDGRIGVFNTGIEFTGKNSTIKGTAYPPDPTVPAKLAVNFFNRTDTTPNYWVLSTDYESYSMVYSCAQETSLLHFTTIWFLVRDYNVSEKMKAEVLGKYKDLGFDTEPLIYTKQGPSNGCH